MKFLIDNYSDHQQSQPLYLNQAFQKMGYTSGIFDITKASVFDACDTFDPDIVLVSAARMSHDLVAYLLQSAKIELIVNIDNVSEDNLKQLTAFLKGNNIKVKFLLTSDYSKPNNVDGFRIVKIMQAADMNQITELHFDYHVEKALVVDKIPLRVGFPCSFHVLSTSPELNGKVDINMSSIALRSILPKYDEIVFENLHSITQLFLNCICSGVKTYYSNTEIKKDNDMKNIINKIYGKEIDLDYNSKDRSRDFSEISEMTKNKHSGFNRAKSVISQIKGA